MPTLSPDGTQSPCRSICKLSADDEVCMGCGRTLDEIARWSGMACDEKRSVNRAAARRLDEGFT
ncbi:DUF1289 domain-containing protein [Qipengyuania flava]|nr:DUF1289 domain-containing protein [Qipengyuania flava]